MYPHDGWFWMSLMTTVWVVVIGVALYVAVRLSRGRAALADGDRSRR